MKSLIIALSEVGRELAERNGGGDPTKVNCEAIWNCHNESRLYNEHILIRMVGNVLKYLVGNNITKIKFIDVPLQILHKKITGNSRANEKVAISTWIQD
jgi:hypothetical protein